MKNFIIAFILALFTFGYATAQQPIENYLGTNEALNFDNTEYTLGWSSHPSEFQYLQEYFPEGQSPEKFNDMLSVWLFVGDFSAKEYIRNMANTYEEREKIDRASHYQSYETDGDYMFECLRSEADGNKLTGIEFNIYRSKDVEIDEKKAMLICFYSGQATGEDIKSFLIKLKERRVQLLEAMFAFEYPTIKLNER